MIDDMEYEFEEFDEDSERTRLLIDYVGKGLYGLFILNEGEWFPLSTNESLGEIIEQAKNTNEIDINDVLMSETAHLIATDFDCCI